MGIIEFLRNKLLKKEFIRFDLEKFKKLYFYDVHTYSKEEFEEYLKEHA